MRIAITRARRRLRPPLLACAAVVALAVAAGPADAHFYVSHYTRDNDNCTNRLVDPMNVVFYGKHAYPSHDAHLMEKLGGWNNSDGGTQSFWTHGECRSQSGQRADNCGVCDRDHMRFFQNKGFDRKGRWGVVSDAHHDVPDVGCLNHKDATPDGPDQGKGMVNEVLYGHVRTSFHNWGNTAGIKQCDGEKARSNGYVLFAGTG